MRIIPRCKKCGEKIGFAPLPGFRRPGEAKYFAVNADDRKPHGPRCRLTLALKKAKQSPSAPVPRTRFQPQGSRAKPETLKTTEGVQIDAFESV